MIDELERAVRLADYGHYIKLSPDYVTSIANTLRRQNETIAKLEKKIEDNARKGYSHSKDAAGPDECCSCHILQAPCSYCISKGEE